MQKIMFEHRRFGLEQAVIARLKENTRRRVRFPKGVNDEDVESAVMGIDQKGRVYFTFSVATHQGTEAVDVYPKYQIGEHVAVAQSYKTIYDKMEEQLGNSKANEWWCKAYDIIGNQFGNHYSNRFIWSLPTSEKEQVHCKARYQISYFWNYWRILRRSSCQCGSFKNLADHICLFALYCSIGYAIRL
jgi:hypothetical protein